MRWPWSKHADELTGHADRADRAVQRADDLLQRADRFVDQAQGTAARASDSRRRNGFGLALHADQRRRREFPWPKKS